MQKFKSSLLIALSILIANLASAQISGKISEDPTALWTLKNMEGVNIPVARDVNGNFNVAINQLKKGIYTLGDVGEIYLEPGYQIKITQTGRNYTFSGKGSLENNLMWESKSPIRNLEYHNPYGVPFWALLTEPAAFLSILGDYEKKADVLLNQSANPFFKEITQQEMKFVTRNVLTHYMRFYGLDSTKGEPLRKMLNTPMAERKPDHSKKQYEAYLLQFSKKFSIQERAELDSIIYKGWDMNNELLFKNSEYYRELIDSRITFASNRPAYQALKDSLKNDDQLKIVIVNREIHNAYIHDYQYYRYTYALIKRSKQVAEIEDSYQQFMNDIKNPAYRKDIELVYHNLKGTQKNTASPEFSFMDHSGAPVSLKSLRGKYVYIDIWATWCAPCIAEIPGLKKLEEIYKDKKIQFVSLSVDTQSNKETWLNYVKKNELKGIQLIADKDFNSDFIKKFGVTSIPRFLLIGPDGSIIENDAKRPSDTTLKKQLDGLLL